MRICAIILFTVFYTSIFAQQKISFVASDSLKVTADLYLKNQNLPFILLFHQGGSSRGEFTEIADRLLKLDYNCLAVDLRSGSKINFIPNETAERAKNLNKQNAYLDAQKDIVAAINFVKKYNSLPVILFGSSYSASLCMIEAKSNNAVKAVIAFSPGEFFRPGLIVKERITDLEKPLFVASTLMEYEYVKLMLAGISEEYIYLYKPITGQGVHGAKALWAESEGSEQCWLELLLFFRKIRF